MRRSGSLFLKSQIQHARSERGAALVIVTAVLAAIIGSMALVFDIGSLYLNWVRLQAAADSSALSGAIYLPQFSSQAIATASSFATENGVAPSEVQSIQVGANNTQLTIELRREVQCAFCSVLAMAAGSPGSGASGFPVQVRSTAGVQCTGSSHVVPIGVQYNTSYKYGQTLTLMQGGVGPGNWGALAIDGPGASTYRDSLENGSETMVSVDDSVETEPGKMVGPTVTGIRSRINADPSSTWDDHSLTSPRAVTVPMVDFSDVSGESEVPVKGFAILWLDGVDGHGNITAQFIQQIAPHSQPGAQGATPCYGAMSVALLP